MSEVKTVAENNTRICVEHLLDMLRRVEWVRQSAGNKYCCPFCACISERDGGPGHASDCEWQAVQRW